MTLTLRLLRVSIGLAAVALAIGYGLGGWWDWTPAILAPAGLWWLGLERGWAWRAPIGLSLFVVTAAGGVLLDLAAGWMLVGVVAALNAWDLDYFVRRLKSVPWDEGSLLRQRKLARRHLQSLLLVDGSSLLLATFALGFEIQFSFVIALGLAALAILGLSQTIGFLRHESD